LFFSDLHITLFDLRRSWTRDAVTEASASTSIQTESGKRVTGKSGGLKSGCVNRGAKLRELQLPRVLKSGRGYVVQAFCKPLPFQILPQFDHPIKRGTGICLNLSLKALHTVQWFTNQSDSSGSRGKTAKA